MKQVTYKSKKPPTAIYREVAQLVGCLKASKTLGFPVCFDSAYRSENLDALKHLGIYYLDCGECRRIKYGRDLFKVTIAGDERMIYVEFLERTRVEQRPIDRLVVT